MCSSSVAIDSTSIGFTITVKVSVAFADDILMLASPMPTAFNVWSSFIITTSVLLDSTFISVLVPFSTEYVKPWFSPTFSSVGALLIWIFSGFVALVFAGVCDDEVPVLLYGQIPPSCRCAGYPPQW